MHKSIEEFVEGWIAIIKFLLMAIIPLLFSALFIFILIRIIMLIF